jgi:hypothetical protein
VARAREALGSSGARVEIRLLPPGAELPPPVPNHRPASRSGPERRHPGVLFAGSWRVGVDR